MAMHATLDKRDTVYYVYGSTTGGTTFDIRVQKEGSRGALYGCRGEGYCPPCLGFFRFFSADSGFARWEAFSITQGC